MATIHTNERINPTAIMHTPEHETLFAHFEETERPMIDRDTTISYFKKGIKAQKKPDGQIVFFFISGHQNENYKELTWMQVADLAKKLVDKK